jgi:hypothetical protein
MSLCEAELSEYQISLLYLNIGYIKAQPSQLLVSIRKRQKLALSTISLRPDVFESGTADAPGAVNALVLVRINPKQKQRIGFWPGSSFEVDQIALTFRKIRPQHAHPMIGDGMDEWVAALLVAIVFVKGGDKPFLNFFPAIPLPTPCINESILCEYVVESCDEISVKEVRVHIAQIANFFVIKQGLKSCVHMRHSRLLEVNKMS